ncbi:unnamed protein product [Chrysoparadoxa australica]
MMPWVGGPTLALTICALTLPSITAWVAPVTSTTMPRKALEPLQAGLRSSPYLEVEKESPTLYETMSQVVTVASKEGPSPYHFRDSTVPLDEAWQQVARRVGWSSEGRANMKVFQLETLLQDSQLQQEFLQDLKTADVFIAAAIEEERACKWLRQKLLQVESDKQSRLVFNSGRTLEEMTRLGSYEPYAGSVFSKLLKRVLGDEDKQLLKTCETFHGRHHPEDLAFMTLLVVNAHYAKIPNVNGLGRNTSLRLIYGMITKCGAEVKDCFTDEKCKAGLDCIEECPEADQVCAYRCITSYETKEFENFSLCILTKHNLLDNHATIPTQPSPPIMTHFRGMPLDWTTAEQLFIGWLGKRDTSWIAVAGLNPAYDAFADQNQLFYRGRQSTGLWYDPCFKVTTIDGRVVWRRRHYKVRRAKRIGSFYFSVLDNGVTSQEYWKLIDVAEDFSWGVFYYAGAASAAAQSYAGALLVTPDGQWPTGAAREKAAEAALAKCGIKLWEMCLVTNGVKLEGETDPPLAIDPEFIPCNTLPTPLLEASPAIVA